MLPEIFLALQFYFSFDLNIITDEPLHPMVKEALQDQGPMLAYKDNAYVYLLGLVAAEGDDSFEVGKERFIAAEKITRYQDRHLLKRYPKEDIPALLQGAKLCNLPDDKADRIRCFEKLHVTCSSDTEWIDKYKFTLDSYDRILASVRLRSPSLIVDIDWNTFELFRSVGTLDNRDLLERSLCKYTADKDKAVSELVYKEKALKRIYAQADDVMLKVILLVHIKDYYQWIVYSYRRGLKELEDLPESFFSLQTKQESSFRPVMHRMIRSNVSINREARESASNGVTGENWLSYLAYKENLTINDMTVSSRNMILDSEVPIDRYVEDRMPKVSKPNFRWWRIGNYVGEILMGVSAPVWVNMSEDFNNLDLIIRLSDIVINYTELVDNNQLSDLPLSKRNPYDNSLPYFDESGRWLCFKVPEELKSQDECMYLH